MRKILHLVLYNPSPTYTTMYEITREWYATWAEKGIDTYYYYYSPDVNVPTVDVENMTLRLPGTESYYPGILMKTLDAFEFFSREGYEFIVRSNISSPVNFKNLQFVEQAMLYGGPHLINPYLVDTQKQNPLVLEIGAMRFVHGTCIVFGPDTIRLLLANRHKLCQTVEDDLSFGLFFARRNIAPHQIGGQYALFSEWTNIDSATTFRNHNVGSDRSSDIRAMIRQVTAYQQRDTIATECPRVLRVWYHNKNVTKEVLARVIFEPWTTNQSNSELDKLFGDPAPGVKKRLTIDFLNMPSLTQCATLTFQAKYERLYVS